MKLMRIRRLGKYRNPATQRPVNVWMGRKKGYGVDILFYYYRGKRVVIEDIDFYNKNKWEEIK